MKTPSYTDSNYFEITEEVAFTHAMKLHGTPFDNRWFLHLKLDNGLTDINSVLILSEIYYWYTPTISRDEESGEELPMKKKFKGKYLQKNKGQLGKCFGLTERQIGDALVRLEKRGLIERLYENVQCEDGSFLGTRMFIRIFPEEIARITKI